MPGNPADGDVLITTEGTDHFLSVVPHPHRISFSQLPQAVEIAKRWAKQNKVKVWQRMNGRVIEVPTED